MDNLGSEVGQKMRSAVKAKLLELGTGGSAGYIDDELPDYVMIMVANKRSKQQMISDLTLFLGSQTDLFVTWLHEVLQKLQEVTLPAVALQKKRKTFQKDDASLNKKDKKEKKKGKKTQKKPPEEESSEITSITDVFAGELLEKAKKTFEIDVNAVHKDKKYEKDTSSIQKSETHDFNIPTITEITSQHSTQDTLETREKDLAELADIQKKIYAAKKQLKILDDVDESEDEDFLKIKEDDGEDVEELEKNSNFAREKKKQIKINSPIIFDRTEIDRKVSPDQVNENDVPVVASFIDIHSIKHTSSDYIQNYNRHETELDQEREAKDGNIRKKSIRERLGHMKDNKSEHGHQRRAEKELFVPSFRRREMEKEMSNGDFDSEANLKRSSSQDKKNKIDGFDDKMPRNNHQRIGSRIIVAPPKPNLSNDDMDNKRVEHPVNSIIKIKPRPSISPSKQACKNLLLRAVAEAQRSTNLVKPKKDISLRKGSSGNGLGGNTSTKRSATFLKKSYRDTKSRDAYIRRAAKNFVIEVNAMTDANEEGIEVDPNEEEYVPENISDRGESDLELIYIPQAIHSTSNEDEDENVETNVESIYQNKTQFVVTLNEKTSSNYKLKSKSSRLNGSEFSNQSELKKASQDKLDVRSRLTINRDQGRTNRKKSNSSPPCGTPPHPSSVMSSNKKSELIKIYKRPKEIKKIVIKNDSEDEDFHSPKKESPNKINNAAKEEKRLYLSNQKQNAENTEEEGSLTPPLPIRKPKENSSDDNKSQRRKRQLIKFDLVNNQLKAEVPAVPAKRRLGSCDRGNSVLNNEEEGNAEEKNKISIKNVESKKYDNLPSSLNSVPIDSSIVIKSKPKERCKYFPTCTKDTCEFYHPATCKSFPNCKFADKCLYIHPKCKFDLTCNKVGCNFQHSASLSGQLSAPPLSSHVVPVQNYKSISSTTTAPSMCKFYPNCSKPGCPFYHPKMCRFGKFCNNKLECNFFHNDAASNKFKWFASIV